MNNKRYCVYKHTSPSNKVYIGMTSQIPEERWSNGNGYNKQHFYSAIQKYGWDNFKHEILFSNLTEDEACIKEIELIALYRSNEPEFGYNITIGGKRSSFTKENREKSRQIQSLRSLERMKRIVAIKEEDNSLSYRKIAEIYSNMFNDKISYVTVKRLLEKSMII